MRIDRRAMLSAACLAVACGKEPPRIADTTHSALGTPDSALRTPHSALRKILFAGTSLTAGLGLDRDSAYSYLLQQKIDSAGLPFETVNAGVSGETTAGLLQRLDWLLRGDFDVLVIETGANDGLRAIDAGAIRNNLTEVVRRVKSAKPGVLVLLIQMEALPNYGRSYGTAFHDLYRQVAKSEGVQLLPFLLDGVAGVSRLNQGDGIHPNMEGEHIVTENLWRGLRPILIARARD